MDFEKLKTSARVAEVAAIFGRFIDISKKAAGLKSDVVFQEITSQAADMKNRAVTAMNRAKTASNLEELDIQRDKFTRAAFQLCHGYEVHPSAKISASASAVMDIFNRHSSITNESYARQTALTDSMLLETDTKKTEIAVLDGLKELLDGVKKANEAFKARATELNAMQVASSADENATSLKKPMVQFLNSEALPYLSMLSKRKGGDYKMVFDELENEIKKLNADIAHRSSRA